MTTLPEGRLLFATATTVGRRVAVLIDLERSHLANGIADVWWYEVWVDPSPIGNEIGTQAVGHSVIECRNRTVRMDAYWLFDAAGTLILWLPSERTEAITRRSTQELQALVICDGAQPPSPEQWIVVGHQAAIEAAPRLIAH
jgi:hypothetical protein